MRCPKCGGLVVYDREKVEFVCALCDSIVDVELMWPYKPEYLETVYAVKTREKEKRAREVIRRHASNAVVALSGKDSMVALHLAVTAEIDVDVVIATYVAETRIPAKVVDELRAFAEGLDVRRIIIHDEPWDVHASLFRIISNRYGYNVVVTGLRREENRYHFGAVEYEMVRPGKMVKLVNPVIDWSSAEVWSYIYHYRLSLPTPYRIGASPNVSLQHLI